MALPIRFYYAVTTFKAIRLRRRHSLYVTLHFMRIFGSVVETASFGIGIIAAKSAVTHFLIIAILNKKYLRSQNAKTWVILYYRR